MNEGETFMKKILAIVLSALICLLPVCHVAAEEGIATVQPGDIVAFGRYPQTRSGKDETPIDWIVLDVKDGKALLCSKYGLDVIPYHTSDKKILWQDCYLRSWLRDEFLYTAFDQDERSAIEETLVDNSTAQGHYPYTKHGGNNTIDQIFVLSAAEANEYLGAEWKREHNSESRVQATEYALGKGARTDKDYKTSEYAPASEWWLRNPSSLEDAAVTVGCDGGLSNKHRSNDKICVRPAFWVDLKSEVFQNENPKFAPEPFVFRSSVLWGMNKEEVMAQEGLDQVEYHSEAMDGMMYIGRNVSVYPCRLYYLFSSDSLAAAFYTIDEPDRDKLDYLKRVYSAKYGDEKEADTDECYRIMKKFGDGADESEFRNGKIYAWETPEGTQIWIISLLPQRDQIYITYVSPYFLKQSETEVMNMDGV